MIGKLWIESINFFREPISCVNRERYFDIACMAFIFPFKEISSRFSANALQCVKWICKSGRWLDLLHIFIRILIRRNISHALNNRIMRSKDRSRSGVSRFTPDSRLPQDFRNQPNIKLELDSSHAVISARSDPASVRFVWYFAEIRRERSRSGRASTAHSSGYLPRDYLLRGADRQKRQIASCRFAEYAFRFTIAARLSACESMNREQIYPRMLQKSMIPRSRFIKEQPFVCIASFFLSLCYTFYFNRCCKMWDTRQRWHRVKVTRAES